MSTRDAVAVTSADRAVELIAAGHRCYAICTGTGFRHVGPYHDMSYRDLVPGHATHAARRLS